MTAPGRDGQDALVALERLLRHGIITQEQAVAAARTITGDPNLVVPPPRPPPTPPAAPAAPEPEAAPEPTPADNASAPGSEAP